ncbi:UNVERIFIED_CONTAM: hypothetical protein K2H54_014986 [Gekko kuhli]
MGSLALPFYPVNEDVALSHGCVTSLATRLPVLGGSGRQQDAVPTFCAGVSKQPPGYQRPVPRTAVPQLARVGQAVEQPGLGCCNPAQQAVWARNPTGRVGGDSASREPQGQSSRSVFIPVLYVVMLSS